MESSRYPQLVNSLGKRKSTPHLNFGPHPCKYQGRSRVPLSARTVAERRDVL